MRLQRRAVLRIGAVSLVGVTAGCANDSGDTTANETDAPADTTETTTGQGGMVSETEAPTETTQPATDTPTTTETTTETETTSPATTATPEEVPTVEMDNIAFSPMELSIEPGTEVRWVNRDGIPHDVVSDQFNSGATQWDFESDRISNGEEVYYTFEEPGTYEYYCSVHGASSMCGVVLVGDASRAGSLPCE